MTKTARLIEISENIKNGIATLTVKSLVSKDGKFIFPHITHIGQTVRVKLSSLYQYDIINPLNGIKEAKITIEQVDENGKIIPNGWLMIECLFD